jgi:acyl-CoA synthetase (AMP-forming)/AMP-acid ligase II
VKNRKLIAGRWVRWDDSRAQYAYDSGAWSRETLADRLKEAATTAPQRILLVDADHRIDSQTLYSRASALAQAMLMRIPPGSVISFMLPNWHEAAVIYLAATLAGMVVNPILPSLRDRELLFILKDLGTRMIFVPASFRQLDYVAMLGRVTALMDPAPEVIVVRGDARDHTSYAALFEFPVSGRALPELQADAVRMVLYTSGTTGRSKGVLHSHNSIHALIRQIRDHWLVEPGDKFLVPSPIGHIGGSIYAFECPLLLGTTAVLMDQWNADAAVKLLLAEGCTHMAGATPFLQQLLAAAEQSQTRLPSLKLFVCGGASVPPALIRQAAAYFENAAVTRVYGSTEVPVTTVGAVKPVEAAYAAETDGRAGLADVKLVDSGGNPGQAGEILARGPQMLVGYLRAEDEAAAFDADGYFRTGDLGAWVDGNYLVVTGRAKDIIIRNGENISPKEIEDLLLGHPEIAEVSIVGLPDARTGERTCAVIVPKAASEPTVESLRSFLLKEGLATFKFPEKVVLWDALPKNDAGKVLKHQIRASLQETM